MRMFFLVLLILIFCYGGN
ncbi:hypothetical protein LINPERPRIM_LOCUS30021 [Linum perenne]